MTELPSAEKWHNKYPLLSKGLIILTAAIVFAVVVDSSSNGSAPKGSASQKPDQANDTIYVKREIIVSSQIVKKVDAKHRYFFDIRNNDKEAFEGSVLIELLKKDGSTLGREIFETRQPISSLLGQSVFIDINTGPTTVYAEDLGISDYKYEVKTKNGMVINRGSGQISSKYETID